MANNFFSGCETWMEDTPVQEDDISIAEVIESVTQASEEIEQDHEFTHEINTVVDQATMLAAKAAELDRMTAYVKAYGVDRSFLSLCNHHNQLATLGMQMPACESFDAVGDPKSATSQAALEGIAQGVRTVWEYIKKIIGRCVDWLARILRFSDVRRALINRRIAKLKEIKVSDLAETSEGEDRRIPGLKYLQANIAKLKGITDEDLKALKESSDNVANVVENDAGKETDYHTSLTNLADKAPITLNRFTAAAQDPLLFATDSLSDTKTSDFPKYVSLAEEAMKRFDEIFKRISDIRNQLSKLKIERAGMDSDSEDAKAKTKAIKQYTIYLKRAKLFFIFPLHLASRACTAAEAIAKTRKKSSSGTESFSFAGLEASKDGSVIENLADDGSYDKTQKRNQYLKDATEIQKKVIAAIQKAAGGKKQYKDLSAVLPKITVSPEDMCENDATFSKNKEWVYVLFKADTHWANYIAVIFGLLRAVQHYTAYDSPGISALPKGVKIARTLAGSNEFAIFFCDNYKKK
jgi:hypothetical protein